MDEMGRFGSSWSVRDAAEFAVCGCRYIRSVVRPQAGLLACGRKTLLSSPATPYSVVVGDVGTCDRRRGDDRRRVVRFGVRVVGGVRSGAVGGLRGHHDCRGQARTGRNAIAPLTFHDRRRYQDSDARQNN